jgi:hypothetical protein
LGYSDISDGGILIRGIRCDQRYINGPRRVVQEIFKHFGQITSLKHEFGFIPKSEDINETIYKTKRHGLSSKQANDFKDHYYRYYTSIDSWSRKHISLSEMEKIKENSSTL